MTADSIKDRSSAVGYVIRKHRKSRGLTQKQLAGELGVEARTLRMYENGERVLESISDLRRIADLLEIDPIELGLAASKHSHLNRDSDRRSYGTRCGISLSGMPD